MPTRTEEIEGMRIILESMKGMNPQRLMHGKALSRGLDATTAAELASLQEDLLKAAEGLLHVAQDRRLPEDTWGNIYRIFLETIRAGCVWMLHSPASPTVPRTERGRGALLAE